MKIENYVILNDWKTKKEILRELKLQGIEVSERYFRASVERHNKLYAEHLEDKFIAHSSKGYKATNDRKEILSSIKDNKKRAIKMLIQESKTLKALGENSNIRFEIVNGDLVLETI